MNVAVTTEGQKNLLCFKCKCCIFMMQFAEKVRNVTTRSVFHLNKSLFCVAAQILCQSTSAEEKKP